MRLDLNGSGIQDSLRFLLLSPQRCVLALFRKKQLSSTLVLPFPLLDSLSWAPAAGALVALGTALPQHVCEAVWLGRNLAMHVRCSVFAFLI